jgi:hypothetical protein
VLALAMVLGLAPAAACASSLTPSDYAEIAGTGADITRCQAMGRACKADGGSNCYGAYDDCMRDAGLR